MFEVGKEYEFRLIIDGDETRMWGVVEKYDHPLLKLQDRDISILYQPADAPKGKKSPSTLVPGEIINVISPNFISAVRAKK